MWTRLLAAQTFVVLCFTNSLAIRRMSYDRRYPITHVLFFCITAWYNSSGLSYVPQVSCLYSCVDSFAQSPCFAAQGSASSPAALYSYTQPQSAQITPKRPDTMPTTRHVRIFSPSFHSLPIFFPDKRIDPGASHIHPCGNTGG
jgi:hypothetical protein